MHNDTKLKTALSEVKLIESVATRYKLPVWRPCFKWGNLIREWQHHSCKVNADGRQIYYVVPTVHTATSFTRDLLFVWNGLVVKCSSIISVNTDSAKPHCSICFTEPFVLQRYKETIYFVIIWLYCFRLMQWFYSATVFLVHSEWEWSRTEVFRKSLTSNLLFSSWDCGAQRVKSCVEPIHLA